MPRRRFRFPVSRTGSLAPQGFRSGTAVGSPTAETEAAAADLASFRAWLSRDNEQRCVLVELDFVDEVDGAPVTSTLYFSDREFFDDVTDHPYTDAVRSAPQYSRQLSGDQLGSYVSSIGSLELDNADGGLDYLLNIACDGSAIRFYFGGVKWLVADFKLIFVAVIARIAAPEFDRISVLLKDAGLLLDKSIGGEVIGGTGPNADRTSPMTLGYVHNLTPLLEDQATLKYRYTDFPRLTSVQDVRDKGVPVAFTDNADRTFTLSASPDGLITADVLAEEDGVGNTKVSDHMRAWIGNRGGLLDLGLYAGPGPTFIVGDEDDYLLGTCIPEPRNLLDLLALINLSGNVFWTVLHTGEFTFGRLRLNDIGAFGLAETVITEDDIDEGSFNLEHATPQYYKFQMYGSRNWTKQTEFASSLTPEDQALYSRAGLYRAQADGVGTSYADRPELYHKTLTVSPTIDTLLSQVFSGVADLAALDRWMEVRRDSFLPWIEVVSITVGIEFYATEIGDPVRLFQVIGIVIRLTDAKIDLRLARRNVIQPIPEVDAAADPFSTGFVNLIEFKTFSSSSAGTNSTYTLNNAAQTGDMIIAIHGRDAPGSSTLSPPSGWGNLGSSELAGIGCIWLQAKVAVGGETSFTFVPFNGHPPVGVLLVYRGANGVASNMQFTANGATSTTHTTTAQGAVPTNALGVCGVCEIAVTGALGIDISGSGWQEVGDAYGTPPSSDGYGVSVGIDVSGGTLPSAIGNFSSLGKAMGLSFYFKPNSVTLIESQTVGMTATTGSIVFTFAHTASAGDLMIAFLNQDSPNVVTNPGGWTSFDVHNSGNRVYRPWYKVAVGGETSVTFALTGGGLKSGIFVNYRGTDGNLYLNAVNGNGTPGTSISGSSMSVTAMYGIGLACLVNHKWYGMGATRRHLLEHRDGQSRRHDARL
jgi:hypothetical protein